MTHLALNTLSRPSRGWLSTGDALGGTSACGPPVQVPSLSQRDGRVWASLTKFSNLGAASHAGSRQLGGSAPLDIPPGPRLAFSPMFAAGEAGMGFGAVGAQLALPPPPPSRALKLEKRHCGLFQNLTQRYSSLQIFPVSQVTHFT